VSEHDEDCQGSLHASPPRQEEEIDSWTIHQVRLSFSTSKAGLTWPNGVWRPEWGSSAIPPPPTAPCGKRIVKIQSGPDQSLDWRAGLGHHTLILQIGCILTFSQLLLVGNTGGTRISAQTGTDSQYNWSSRSWKLREARHCFFALL
jgi:hypothetical protein